jgi:hypothetical protein
VAVLNGEAVEAAQGKAEECWRVNEEQGSARERQGVGSRESRAAEVAVKN